jgi:hypothetical protein
MADPLARKADTLVSAALIQSVAMFAPLHHRYEIVKTVDHDHWDFVLTIAGVFIATARLEQLDLGRNREHALLGIVVRRLAEWAPDGPAAFDDCKRMYENEYDRLAARGHDPQFVASDALGIWAMWSVLGRQPANDAEAALTREVGSAVTHAFVNWWSE